MLGPPSAIPGTKMDQSHANYVKLHLQLFPQPSAYAEEEPHLPEGAGSCVYKQIFAQKCIILSVLQQGGHIYCTSGEPDIKVGEAGC